MNSNANKTERFLKAINSDAEARCNTIKKEVDDYIDNELKKARRLAHHNVRPVKSSEFDRLNEEINAELSETETKGIEKLVERRNEITEDVFSQATAKIKAFTESDGYRSFLLDSAKQIISAIGDGAVIILKPDDKRFEPDIRALGSEVRYDELIRLGGCKGENTKSSLTADDTLDSRLEAEKQKFYGYSGLSLSL